MAATLAAAAAVGSCHAPAADSTLLLGLVLTGGAIRAGSMAKFLSLSRPFLGAGAACEEEEDSSCGAGVLLGREDC